MGGSGLSDVEDVFVGEEADLPNMVKCVMRPSEEEVDLHNKTRPTVLQVVPPLRQRQG